MNRIPEWVRSSIITFAIAFAGLALDPNFEWTQAAIFAALLAAARTALSGILPGGSFGTDPSVGDPDATGYDLAAVGTDNTSRPGDGPQDGVSQDPEEGYFTESGEEQV